MFGLPKSILGKGRARRKADSAVAETEVKVLRALQTAAKRSSPHKASTRANIARAIGMIEAATLGLCHVRELVVEAEGLCHSALSSGDPAKRALVGQRYGDLIGEINAIAAATGHGGVHLIDGSHSSFTVELGEGQSAQLKLPHINLTAGPQGLALPKPSRAFASDRATQELKVHLGQVKAHLEKAATIFRDHGAELSTHLAMVLESALPSPDELEEPRKAALPGNLAGL